MVPHFHGQQSAHNLRGGSAVAEGVKQAHGECLHHWMGDLPEWVDVHLASSVDMSGLDFCPCKPCPFGNDYHMVCCALTDILFSIELVEGKELQPPVPLEFKGEDH